MAIPSRSEPLLLACLLVALLGAGCAGSDSDGPALDPTVGAVAGVVVDERIVPIDGARVVLRGAGGERSAMSGTDGLFAFADVAPGTYFLAVTHLLYAPAQVSVDVQAGREPPTTKVLLTRLFTQQAYSEALKFDGYIQCGYSTPPIETQCVDDYTRFVVPGGMFPELKEALDHRFYISSVGPGWQALVMELVWEATAQGTSPEMFLATSYYNRTGTDWFGEAVGPSPQLLRLEVGKDHPSNSGSPGRIPDEGQPDLYTFAGIHGETGAVGLSQPFRIFQHNFYFGDPPEDWSFVRGDSPPF